MNPPDEPIEVAILTRGDDIDYEWRASWLPFGELSADSEARKRLADYRLTESPGVGESSQSLVVDILSFGLAVSQVENRHALILTGVECDYRSPARPGRIYAAFAFFGLNKIEARSLAFAMLSDWHTLSQQLGVFITRRSSAALDGEWGYDTEAIRRWLAAVPECTPPNLAGDASRTGLPYADLNKVDFFPDYPELVAKSRLTGPEGVQLLIGKPSSEAASRRLIGSAALLAMPAFVECCDLDELKKKSLPESTQRKSGGRNRPPRASSQSSNELPLIDCPSRVRDWLKTCSDRRKIFLGGALLGFLAVSAILMMKTCGRETPPKTEKKEKHPESAGKGGETPSKEKAEMKEVP